MKYDIDDLPCSSRVNNYIRNNFARSHGEGDRLANDNYGEKRVCFLCGAEELFYKDYCKECCDNGFVEVT